MTNSISINNFKKVSSVILTATLVVSGFFVAGFVSAEHTANVNYTIDGVTTDQVKGNDTNTYTFTITNNGSDSIYKINITVPSSFTFNDLLICPAGWVEGSGSDFVTCTDETYADYIIHSGSSAQVSLSAISSVSNGEYTWTVKTTDILSSPLQFQIYNPVTIVDATPPTIELITTKDTNSDGKVETATIVFSEAVDDSTFLASNFTIGGSAANTVETGIANDNTFDIVLTEGVEGTEAKDVTYTQGAGADLVGNLLANVGSGDATEIDGANPTFVSATATSDTNVNIIFSEPIFIVGSPNWGTVITATDFTVTSVAVDGFALNITVDLLNNTAYTASDLAISAEIVEDAAFNRNNSVSGAAIADGQAPILSSVETKTINTIELTFSEPISVVSADDFSVSGNSVTNIAIEGDNTKAILTLDTEIGTGDTPDVSTAEEPTGTTDVAGNLIVGSLSLTPEDGILPVVSSATADPDPAKAGDITITVVFSENMDTTISPTIQITGITGSPITVSQSNYIDDTWAGTFPLTDNEEEIPAAISVAGAVDIAENVMVENANAGTFDVDTVEPAVPTVTLTDPINLSNQNAAVIDGSGEPGVAVDYSISDGTNSLTGSGIVSAEGTISITGINVTSLDDGILTLTVTLTDAAGNISASGTDTATKDTVAPVIPTITTFTDPVNNANKTAIILEGTGEANATLNYSIDDINGASPVTGTIAIDGSGNYSKADIDVSTLSDGTLTATINVIDTAGNISGDTTDTAVKDIIVPTVAITYNLTSPVKAGEVVITATYSEPIESTPQISIDQLGTADIAGVAMTDSGDQTIWTYTYTVNTANGAEYVDGEANVSLSDVVDAAGNNADLPAGTTFTVDTTAPTVALTYSADPAKAGAMTITATYSEPIVGTPFISIDQPGTTDVSGVAMSSSDQTVWTYSYTVIADNSTEYVDGVATVSLSSQNDAAGNTADLPTENTFIIDTVKPVVNITSPVDNEFIYSESKEIVVDFSATDVSAEVTCQYQLKDLSDNISCSGGLISGVFDGKQNLVITATDAAGNSDSQTVLIVIDTDGILSVGKSGTEDFVTIQAAIDKASSGGTIQIATGTYDEGSLTFNKNGITLIGSGVGETIIITSSNTYGVSVPSGVNDITVKDLTIRENDTYNTPTCSGSSSERFHLKITHNSGFTLENVNLEGPGKANSCIVGLDLNSVQDVIVRNVRISGYSTNGVGIAAKQSQEDIATSDLLFDGVTIDNNGYTGSTGWAGISFYTSGGGGSTGDIANVQFLGINTISNNPIGVYVENTGGDVSITGTDTTTLSGNSVGPLVTTNLGDLSIVDAYAKDVFNVPVRLENAFASPPDSFVVGYFSDVASAGTAAINPLADGNPTIFNLIDNEWYVVEGMSIQSAIDAAASGGTVNVAAGTYNEKPTIDNALTLKGAQFGIDPALGTRIDASAESIIDVGGGFEGIKINASNVTIDGFTMQNSKYFLIQTDTSQTQDNVVLRNNILSQGRVQFYTINDLEFFHNQISGFSVWSSSGVVSNNTMGNVLMGIALYGCDGLTVQGNTITAREGENTDNGIYINGGSDIVVKGNTITGFTAGERSGYIHGTAGAGIQIYSGSDGFTIENNNLRNNSVGVYVATINTMDTPTNVAVHFNNIEDNNHYGVCNFRFPPQLKDPVTSESLNYWDYDEFSPANNDIDATENWWGSDEGPTNAITNPHGDGDAVSDNVNFVPWYTNAELTDLDETPSTAVLSNTPNKYTNSTDVAITVGGVDVVYYKYNLDNTSYSGETLVGTPITASNLTEGSHTISVIGRDQAGNWQGEATTYSWTVDATKPDVPVITSVATDDKINNAEKATIVMVGTAEANSSVEASLTDGAGVTVSGTQQLTGGATAYSITIDGTTLADGTVNVSVTVTDAAGNDSDSATASVIKDTAAPTVPSDVSATAVIDGNIKISFADVNEEGTGVATYSIKRSSTSDGTYTQITTITDYDLETYTYTDTELSEGNIYYYVVTAIDVAENEGEQSSEVSAISDATAPTVTSYTPSDNAVGIDPGSDITVTFDETVNISSGNINLQIEDKALVSVTVTFDDATKIATIDPDSDLADNSRYDITLSGVTDLAGNTLADYDWSFTTAASYSIDLKIGWNLISLPVTPTTWVSTVEVLTSVNGNVERVWSYDAVSGEWSVYNADGVASDLNIMTAGHGYWVKMTGDDTLEGVGTLYEQLIPSGDTPSFQLPEVSLAEGWNLIGYYQLPGKVNAPIEYALSKLDGYWSGNGRDLITFTKGTLLPLTPIYEMQPGEGYWIFMSSAKKYSFGDGEFQD